MRKRCAIALLAAALPLAGLALAQTIDGLDLQAVMRRSAEATGKSQSDAEALSREVARHGEAMRAEALETVTAGQANLDGAAQSLRVGSDGLVDFDAIVSAAGASQEARSDAPQLIVFASLSMPADSLKPLIRDAARAGGSVVFNGFPGNSMKAFQQGLVKVVDDKAAYGNIGVDPRLFRAFAVTSVPAFVVTGSDFELCDGFACTTQVPPHDRMSGNVTLGHVLQTFADGGGPGARISAQALRRLKDSE